MRDYVKRVTKMIPKLSQEQLQRVIKNVANENAMFDSILESLTTGLIVVDKQWRILKFNKISERFLSFIHFEDESNRRYKKVWEVISDVDVSEFLRDCADKDKSNISQEFSIPLPNSDNLTRFIVVYVLASNFLQLKSYNILNKLTMNSRSASDDVVLVIIDDKSLHEIGRWPWKREYYLEIFDYFENYTKAKLMGYDGLIMAPDLEHPKSDKKFFSNVGKFKKLTSGVAFSQEEFDKEIDNYAAE